MAKPQPKTAGKRKHQDPTAVFYANEDATPAKKSKRAISFSAKRDVIWFVAYLAAAADEGVADEPVAMTTSAMEGVEQEREKQQDNNKDTYNPLKWLTRDEGREKPWKSR